MERISREEWDKLGFRDHLLLMIAMSQDALVACRKCGCVEVAGLINDGLIRMKSILTQSVLTDKDEEKFSKWSQEQEKRLEKAAISSGHANHVKAGRSH